MIYRRWQFALYLEMAFPKAICIRGDRALDCQLRDQQSQRRYVGVIDNDWLDVVSGILPDLKS